MEAESDMTRCYVLRPLRIVDAPLLAERLQCAVETLLTAGLEDLLHPGSSTADWIRARHEEEKVSSGFLSGIYSGEENRLLGIAGLRRIDRIRSCADLMFWLPIDVDGSTEILDDVMKEAFYRFDLHRVEMRIEVREEISFWLTSSGWTQDGILRSALPTETGFVDAALLSMLHEEFIGYGIAFVPFARGWIHIQGGRGFVDAIDFLRPDLPIEPGPLLSAAFRQGICDSEGVLAPADRSSRMHRKVRLPKEVAKAVRQMEEYLAGSRKSFDLKTRVPGSPFQRKVWALLEAIPFGTTLTYEQVALRLTNNDTASARRLSRAVGSACSANPLPVVVPCHRVIGKDNTLVGFSGGLDVKEWLLDHEMFGVH